MMFYKFKLIYFWGKKRVKIQCAPRFIRKCEEKLSKCSLIALSLCIGTESNPFSKLLRFWGRDFYACPSLCIKYRVKRTHVLFGVINSPKFIIKITSIVIKLILQ